ncbi:SGNH/GDSL hydrolase family protein [Salinibacterium sp. ZJ454]|uniref:SGNH/GDSL hydrolase family protein n=1 Tax=Salinibacterium sp. ZJ454 TaxID=2708339 RepID=UPI00141F77AE|nr:SGNH/GDSL hydrolase family protein [Salinibacterium sp. ZJ454]
MNLRGGVGRAVGALALGAGLLVGAAPAIAVPAPTSAVLTTTAAAARAELVVFGDSYSAGIGAGTMQPNPQIPGCYQAAPGYGDLLGQRAQLHLAMNAACYGATSLSVQRQIAIAVGGGYLDTDTGLVTITAGGNDVDFGGILHACREGTPTCQRAIGVASASIPAVRSALVADYSVMRQRAPHATIVALGYPHLLDPSIAGTGMISSEAAALFNGGTDVLNAAIADAAAQVPGVVYADVVGRFEGHGIGAADPWIWFDPSGTDPRAFHPTALGYKGGYYQAVISLIGAAQL